MATSASTTRRHQSATNAKQRQEQQVEETRIGGTTTTTSTTTTSTTGGGGDPATKPTLEEQLDKAEYAVRKSKYAAAQVHYWWRQHLFRLSLLVFLLSFHQARRPSEACIQNIKSINNLSSSAIGSITGTHISGWQAVSFIVNDSVVEVMGLIMMASLTLFLFTSTSDATTVETPISFANRHYMMATALIPLQIAAFFQNDKIGCLKLLSNTTMIPMDEEDLSVVLSSPDRSFPISVIFHTVVTVSCWFMMYQMQHRTDAVKQVLDMRKALEGAQRQKPKDNNTKKQKHTSKQK